MTIQEKVQWTLEHLGNDPYILAQQTGVPIRVINNLLWGRLTINQIRLIDAERLAACVRPAGHPVKL